MASPCDIGLAADVRAHAARARSALAAFDASPWVGITARSARGRVRRLNGSPWVAVIRPAALAPTRNPDPREAFGSFASGPRPAVAHDSTCPKRRRPGFAHVECKIYICTYEAASRLRPHKSSCPCRGARRLPRDPSRGFGCAAFAYSFSAKEKPLRATCLQGLNRCCRVCFTRGRRGLCCFLDAKTIAAHRIARICCPADSGDAVEYLSKCHCGKGGLDEIAFYGEVLTVAATVLFGLSLLGCSAHDDRRGCYALPPCIFPHLKSGVPLR